MTSCGKLEMGRAGLLGGGDGEGLAHRLGDDAGVVHACVPLGHRLEHLDHVDELMRLLVHAAQLDLTGERDHRGIVEVGVGDAGGEVGGAGAERGQADAGLAGEAAVGVGHERGALLVTRGHEDDALAVVERLAHVERLFAGDAEHVLDTLVLEALDEDLRCQARRRALGLARRAETLFGRRAMIFRSVSG